MARLACTLEDRPLPAPDDLDVLALLPACTDAAAMATDSDGHPVGAAWWHIHEPSLGRDADGAPQPELAMAVTEGARGKGIGTALVEAVAAQASERFER